MPQYTFKINELEYRTVDALDLDDALEHAGIAKDDPYELIEGDDFDDKCLMSAITQTVAQTDSLSRTPFPSCLSSVRITHYMIRHHSML